MTSSFNYFVKDPDAILDYTVDWHNWLCSDVILTGTWIVPSGITKTAESMTTTLDSIWLSGGTNGKSYNLVNRITTSAGRKDDRSVTILVRDK